jgi:hypothetical protein
MAFVWVTSGIKRYRDSASAHATIMAIATAVLAASPAWAGATFLGPFTSASTIASTVPANGDVNPYGVAVIPATIGDLTQGNILVSNFNNSANLQGQGSTIVQITPAGAISTFATLSAGALHGSCPGGVGLTTALAVLTRGWVIVGSLPTTGSNASFSGAGCLIVLNSDGQQVETFAGAEINGPWDMAALDKGASATLFVTSVLNGNVANAGGSVINQGSVVRLDLSVPQANGSAKPSLKSSTVIGSGFSTRTDPAALIIGPTGVALGPRIAGGNSLYVADTLNNRIAAIPDAITRTTSAFTGEDVTANGSLNQPLGLTIAPDGDILTVNAGDGNIVETTPAGAQVATFTLIPNGGGALFGLAVTPEANGVYFVNDDANSLMLLN